MNRNTDTRKYKADFLNKVTSGSIDYRTLKHRPYTFIIGKGMRYDDTGEVVPVEIFHRDIYLAKPVKFAVSVD